MSMYSKPSDDDDLVIFVTKNLIFASSDFWLSKLSEELATGKFLNAPRGLTLVAFPPI